VGFGRKFVQESGNCKRAVTKFKKDVEERGGLIVAASPFIVGAALAASLITVAIIGLAHAGIGVRVISIQYKKNGNYD
jgi:hypothetical protein